MIRAALPVRDLIRDWLKAGVFEAGKGFAPTGRELPRVHYAQLLLRPLMAADQPQAPPELRQALRTLNKHVDNCISRARLGKAA